MSKTTLLLLTGVVIWFGAIVATDRAVTPWLPFCIYTGLPMPTGPAAPTSALSHDCACPGMATEAPIARVRLQYSADGSATWSDYVSPVDIPQEPQQEEVKCSDRGDDKKGEVACGECEKPCSPEEQDKVNHFNHCQAWCKKKNCSCRPDCQ